MDYLATIFDMFRHLDTRLAVICQSYGTTTYLILFGIIFLETGVVVTPFLPGDSLLFAAGALSTVAGVDGGSGLSVVTLLWSLFLAAFFGDSVNYAIGHRVGAKAFANPRSRIFRQEYLKKTEQFYERYGNKTIVLARFVPIVRTFAPFLAGVGRMNYRTFGLYNAFGAALWVVSLVGAGHLFGEVPFVKQNFEFVILAIIIISLLPPVIEVLRERGRIASTEAK
jgi:membrane-associated protein